MTITVNVHWPLAHPMMLMERNKEKKILPAHKHYSVRLPPPHRTETASPASWMMISKPVIVVNY